LPVHPRQSYALVAPGKEVKGKFCKKIPKADEAKNLEKGKGTPIMYPQFECCDYCMKGYLHSLAEHARLVDVYFAKQEKPGKKRKKNNAQLSFFERKELHD